jgi:hypothetical protein
MGHSRDLSWMPPDGEIYCLVCGLEDGEIKLNSSNAVCKIVKNNIEKHVGVE